MTLRQVLRPAAALLMTLALLAPARAFAQGATVGVEGGWNYSNVSFDLSDVSISPKAVNGGIGGVFFGMDRGKAGLVVEVLYSQKGTKFELSEGGDSVSSKVRVDFIEIPVLFRGNLKSGNNVVHLFVGPSFGIKAHETEEDTITSGGITTTEKTDPDVKSGEVGLVFGAQMDINKIFFGARYNLGLTDLNKNTGSDEPKVKTRTFSLLFGFKFK